MTVWLNGERRDVDGAATIAELATRLGLAPHSVLVEHNGVALREREWSERQLNDGDRIEFVRVAAGG